jgi:hypothetical protein
MLDGELKGEGKGKVEDKDEGDKVPFTSTFSIQDSAFQKWAHQDSNLGRAGYEPAALTAELWAHYSLQSKVGNRQWTADCGLKTADSVTSALRETP